MFFFFLKPRLTIKLPIETGKKTQVGNLEKSPLNSGADLREFLLNFVIRIKCYIVHLNLELCNLTYLHIPSSFRHT